MRIGIGIVSIRDHKPRFVESLTGLLMHTFATGPSFGLEFLTPMFAMQSSVLSWGREMMFRRARELNLTHLLSWDDDTTCSPDALQIMASRKLPIVAANYLTKNHLERNFTAYDLNNTQIDSRGKTGTQEASRVGFGLILIDLKAIAAVPEPHFEVLWKPEESKYGYMPEDFYFIKKVREHGIGVYVDHDVSQRVGHVGDYAYTQDSPLYPKP